MEDIQGRLMGQVVAVALAAHAALVLPFSGALGAARMPFAWFQPVLLQPWLAKAVPVPPSLPSAQSSFFPSWTCQVEVLMAVRSASLNLEQASSVPSLVVASLVPVQGLLVATALKRSKQLPLAPQLRNSAIT